MSRTEPREGGGGARGAQGPSKVSVTDLLEDLSIEDIGRAMLKGFEGLEELEDEAIGTEVDFYKSVDLPFKGGNAGYAGNVESRGATARALLVDQTRRKGHKALALIDEKMEAIDDLSGYLRGCLADLNKKIATAKESLEGFTPGITAKIEESVMNQFELESESSDSEQDSFTTSNVIQLTDGKSRRGRPRTKLIDPLQTEQSGKIQVVNISKKSQVQKEPEKSQTDENSPIRLTIHKFDPSQAKLGQVTPFAVAASQGLAATQRIKHSGFQLQHPLVVLPQFSSGNSALTHASEKAISAAFPMANHNRRVVNGSPGPCTSRGNFVNKAQQPIRMGSLLGGLKSWTTGGKPMTLPNSGNSGPLQKVTGRVLPMQDKAVTPAAALAVPPQSDSRSMGLEGKAETGRCVKIVGGVPGGGTFNTGPKDKFILVPIKMGKLPTVPTGTQSLQDGRLLYTFDAVERKFVSVLGRNNPCKNPVASTSARDTHAHEEGSKSGFVDVTRIPYSPPVATGGTIPNNEPVQVQVPQPPPPELYETGLDPQPYCICNQVSFGQMIACDGKNCPIQWFHFPCVGIVATPVGKWYCSPSCAPTNEKKKKRNRHRRH